MHARECLAAQGSGDEARSMLTNGLEGLDRQPSLSKSLESRRQSAGKALAAILDSRGQKDQADVWRKQLATTKPTTLPRDSARVMSRLINEPIQSGGAFGY